MAIDKRYGIRGRGRPQNPLENQSSDTEKNEEKKSRYITLELGGMGHSIDSLQPYNSDTTIIQNLEPHKGGYIPRYNDESIITETNNNLRPIACVKIGNHTIYPIRYLARNQPLPDWVYVAKRGNTAYLKINSNYIVSIGLIGEITNYNPTTQTLQVKTISQLPHFYAWGGYIQVDRSLYKYDSYTIDETGIATLTNITGVVTQTISPLTPNTPAWWVCSNIVENAPQMLEFDISYDNNQTEWWWPIPTPIVYGYYDAINKNIVALWDQNNSILPIAIIEPPPKAWTACRRHPDAHYWANNRKIYHYPYCCGGWAGLSMFDTAVPKWHRNPGCSDNQRGDETLPPVPSFMAARYNGNNDFTHAPMANHYIYQEDFNSDIFSPRMADWFRPFVKPSDTNYYVRSGDFKTENFRIVNSLVRLYNRVLEGIMYDVDTQRWFDSRHYWDRLRYRGEVGTGFLSNYYDPGYTINQIFRHTSDYEFRCLRYPPRARLAAPYAAFDHKGYITIQNKNIYNFSFYEMTSFAPYRSEPNIGYAYEFFDNQGRPLRTLLTPCWDIYSDNAVAIWCSRKGITPFVALEDDENFSYPLFYGKAFLAGSQNIQAFHYFSQFLPAALSYGFKLLKTKDPKKVIISARMIANGTADHARIIIRNLDPRQYGNDTPFEITNSINNNIAATAVRTAIKDYYDNYFKTRIGKEDGSTMTDDYFPSDPFERPKYTFRIDLSSQNALLPDLSRIPNQYTHVDMLIPELHIYGCGEWDRSDLSKVLKFYAIKLLGSGNNRYIEEIPSLENLAPLDVIGYERLIYDEKSSTEQVPQTIGDPKIKRFRPLARKVSIYNLRVRVPIPKDGSVYGGLEIRILPRWTQDAHDKGESPPLPIPPCDFVDPATSPEEYPAYTTLVLHAFQATSDAPNKPLARHWYAYFPLVPALQREALIRTVSAVILHGETYGIQSVSLSKVDYGTKATLKVHIPNITPSANRLAKVWLLIGAVTATGQVVVYKEELTDADSNTTKTITLPTTALEGIGAPFHYSETKPEGTGEITAFANRIVHKATSALQLSAVIDGLAWQINPLNELSGISLPLPDGDLILGNHTGKVFVANNRATYMLYGENAFNLGLLPSETSVSPQPIFKRTAADPVRVVTNFLDGLCYLGEDGVYLGDDKVLGLPELMPENTLGIFILGSTGNYYIIVEKENRYEIYMNDKHSNGFVLWTLDKQTPTSAPRLKHAELTKGYLHLIAPDGLSIATTDVQVVALGKSKTRVPTNKTLYRSGALRIPEGVRVRKAKLQIADTSATHNTNVCQLKVYRRPDPTPANLVSQVNIQVAEPIRSRTVPITSTEHKLESVTVELAWLHDDTAIKAIEFIPSGGLNF